MCSTYLVSSAVTTHKILTATRGSKLLPIQFPGTFNPFIVSFLRNILFVCVFEVRCEQTQIVGAANKLTRECLFTWSAKFKIFITFCVWRGFEFDT